MKASKKLNNVSVMTYTSSEYKNAGKNVEYMYFFFDVYIQVT